MHSLDTCIGVKRGRDRKTLSRWLAACSRPPGSRNCLFHLFMSPCQGGWKLLVLICLSVSSTTLFLLSLWIWTNSCVLLISVKHSNSSLTPICETRSHPFFKICIGSLFHKASNFNFEILLLTHKAVHPSGPSSLTDLLHLKAIFFKNLGGIVPSPLLTPPSGTYSHPTTRKNAQTFQLPSLKTHFFCICFWCFICSYKFVTDLVLTPFSAPQKSAEFTCYTEHYELYDVHNRWRWIQCSGGVTPHWLCSVWMGSECDHFDQPMFKKRRINGIISVQKWVSLTCSSVDLFWHTVATHTDH